MIHTMLDAAPIPAPARCGRKKSDYQYYSHHNGLILKNDTTQKGQTSMEVSPATSADYDNTSILTHPLTPIYSHVSFNT